MLLAKQDQDVFREESNKAMHEALAGVTEVKLHVEDARDLQSINYIKQVSEELSCAVDGHPGAIVAGIRS